jgi:hypothetical protein
LKLSKDSPILPSRLLPKSFNLPARSIHR